MADQPIATQQPRQNGLYESPARMLTYAQAAELLTVTVRTVRRRVANGLYLTYGEGPGKRVLYHSILADIHRGAGRTL
jgi:hypothetical protein